MPNQLGKSSKFSELSFLLLEAIAEGLGEIAALVLALLALWLLLRVFQ